MHSSGPSNAAHVQLVCLMCGAAYVGCYTHVVKLKHHPLYSHLARGLTCTCLHFFLYTHHAIIYESNTRPCCCRGSCYGMRRTGVMLKSLHVAAVLVRVRHFERKGLCQLQNWHFSVFLYQFQFTKLKFVTDKDLCSRNTLLTLKLLLHVSSSTSLYFYTGLYSYTYI